MRNNNFTPRTMSISRPAPRETLPSVGPPAGARASARQPVISLDAAAALRCCNGWRVAKGKHRIVGHWETTILVLVAGLLSLGSTASSQDRADEQLLTLEQAVVLAEQNNRMVRNAALEVEKSDDRLREARTHRLPVIDVNVLEAHTLQDFSLTFPAGMFGSFPGFGPFPPLASKVTARPEWVTFATGGVSQPLTQLYRIHLGIEERTLARAAADEDLQKQQQAIAAEVRRAYYEILRIQSAWDATQEEIRLYRELDRLTDSYLLEQAALKSDSLEVKMRLAKAEYQSVVLSNGLATQKESLNVLLGRDVHMPFRVSDAPEETVFTYDIQAAERHALKQRPEVKAAALKEREAEYDRRLKKAEYIPDLSLTARYVSNYNILFNPNSIGVAGFYLSWEPFDWGRKRHELAEKTRTIEQAANGVKESESRIVVDVDNCFRQLEEAETLLKVNRLGKEAAGEKLRVITSKYQEQSALLREVLEQQARLAGATHEYQQALLGYWTARSEFERALGEQ